MKHIWISAILVLGACTTQAAPDEGSEVFSKVTFAAEQATDTERAACEASGGTVERRGRLGADFCEQPYPDAGESCQSASDCLGRCEIEEKISDPKRGTAAGGVCQATTNSFGCRTLIEGGLIEGTLCVD